MKLNKAEAEGRKRRVELTLGEIIDPDVTHISFVDKGANQAPLKIIKRATPLEPTSEGKGMNFHSHILGEIRKTFGGAPEGPALAQYIVAPSPRAKELVAHIEGIEGLEVIEKSEEGGAVTLAFLKDFDSEDAMVLKLDEDLYAVYSQSKKHFMSFPDSTEFSENMATTGFVPGFHMGLDTLAMTVSNQLAEARTKEEAKNMFSKAVTEFSTHVDQLLDMVPMTAFKAESTMKSVVKAVVQAPADDEAEKKVKAQEEAKAALQKAHELAAAAGMTLIPGSPAGLVGGPGLPGELGLPGALGPKGQAGPAMSGITQKSSEDLAKEAAEAKLKTLIEEETAKLKAAGYNDDMAAAAAGPLAEARLKAGDVETPTPEEGTELTAAINAMGEKLFGEVGGVMGQLREEMLAGLKKTEGTVATVVGEVQALKEESEAAAMRQKELEGAVNGTVQSGASPHPTTADNLVPLNGSGDDWYQRMKAGGAQRGGGKGGNDQLFDSAIVFPGEPLPAGVSVETA